MTHTPSGNRGRRLCFIVESGTDVRLVDGLAERWPLTVLARRIVGGREISQATTAVFDRRVGPASFACFGLWAAIALARERRSTGVAVVQGFGVAALFANIAGRLAGIPVVMLVCSPTDAYYRCRRAGGDRPFRRREWLAIRLLALLNARIGRRYVVLSPYLASVVQRHGTARPIDVVPVYGVDAGVFTPSAEARDDVRRRLGLPVEPVLLFFSSRIAPEKDPDTLLAAVAALRNTGRDVRILHRSGGHEAFVRRACEYGLQAAVSAGPAIPPGPELADYYRASNVCVQASREEGLGFSPLEALACRVPVVAAAVGGLCDTIVDGRTGWTYPPGDAQALARAIVQALDDPAEAMRRAEEGRQFVTHAFERTLAFTQFESVVARVLSLHESQRAEPAAIL